MVHSPRSTWMVVVATALAAALAACEEHVTGPLLIPPPTEYAFVITTDDVTGSSSWVSADTLLDTEIGVAAVHTSAVARYYDGRIYVVNRNGADNIQVLEPESGFATIKQFSVGIGSDPHDIVFSTRSRAFVSRYNEDQLWIVDPSRGSRSGLIDFSWLADGDFIPEMDRMLKIGSRVFVSVQRLNRNTDWGPVGTSYVAVFNADTEQFVDADPLTAGTQALRLVGTNPSGEMVLNPDTPVIWLPTVGRLGVNDGGLEVINPETLQSQLVLTESQLGGDIRDVVPIDENRGVAIVSDSNLNTMLIGFDLSAGPIDTLLAPGSELQDAELSKDGRIFVSDRTAVLPGIRIFFANSGTQITTTPVGVGLPPSDIEFTR